MIDTRRAARAGLLAIAVLGGASVAASTAHAGLTPSQIHVAYGLPRTSTVAQTIAVVVAYDAPTAAQDLRAFTARFGIPACSTTDGCLRKVNQRGEPAPLPGPDPTGGRWVSEAALGVQTARGVCQNCRILLVEADSDGRAELAAAVATAVRLGATEVATAYLQSDEDAGRDAYDHPGVAITAATGDNGYFDGANYPASLPGVVAVGGTRLTLGAGGRYRGETVWNDGPREITTSGCTIFSRAPRWQVAEAASVGCGRQRSVADVAAVAAPGAEIYTSTKVFGLDGWIEAGGTSFASPLVAGVFALAGGVPAGTSAPALLYANFRARAGELHDVTRGSNGPCQKPLCRARTGYDGPTGIGTPNGLGAFRAAPVGRLDARRPRVTVSPKRGTVRVSSRGDVRLSLRNENRFAVTVSARLRTGSVNVARSRTSVSVPARSGRSAVLRLSSAGRALIERRGRAKVTVTLAVRDGGGHRATVVHQLVVRDSIGTVAP